MNKIYYKGKAFDFEQIELNEDRVFVLYDGGKLMHQVAEDELDIRSRVSLILDAYYESLRSTNQRSVITQM